MTYPSPAFHATVFALGGARRLRVDISRRVNVNMLTSRLCVTPSTPSQRTGSTACQPTKDVVAHQIQGLWFSFSELKALKTEGPKSSLVGDKFEFDVFPPLDVADPEAHKLLGLTYVGIPLGTDSYVRCDAKRPKSSITLSSL